MTAYLETALNTATRKCGWAALVSPGRGIERKLGGVCGEISSDCVATIQGAIALLGSIKESTRESDRAHGLTVLTSRHFSNAMPPMSRSGTAEVTLFGEQTTQLNALSDELRVRFRPIPRSGPGAPRAEKITRQLRYLANEVAGLQASVGTGAVEIECPVCGGPVETYLVPTERMSGWCYPCQRHIKLDLQPGHSEGDPMDRKVRSSVPTAPHLLDRISGYKS